MFSNILFTQERYNQMKNECKSIVKHFYEWYVHNIHVLGADDDNVEECEVSEERIKQLFDDLSQAMNICPVLAWTRDNKGFDGQYSEKNNMVLLPDTIPNRLKEEIVCHICHELYHAYQFCAISHPEHYPVFNKETIIQWTFEFSPDNYENGGNDIHNYLSQKIEIAARDFANEISTSYII